MARSNGQQRPVVFAIAGVALIQLGAIGAIIALKNEHWARFVIFGGSLVAAPVCVFALSRYRSHVPVGNLRCVALIVISAIEVLLLLVMMLGAFEPSGIVVLGFFFLAPTFVVAYVMIAWWALASWDDQVTKVIA